jgi:hypothetical protein
MLDVVDTKLSVDEGVGLLAGSDRDKWVVFWYLR